MRPVGFRSAVNVLHVAMSTLCVASHPSPRFTSRARSAGFPHSSPDTPVVFSLASAGIRFFPTRRDTVTERPRFRVAVRVFHPEDFWTRSVKRKEVTGALWGRASLDDAGKSGGERAGVG